ncbi:hypothetical protein [Variovorax saccharolyticus]|uniref:hypothetical protein n=1 Tax=Variovorax saccharolyticus TaxID=3053516 RepID=UPI002578B3CD|nr:hypothetical protein [Variovorax sp. J31P216]MDM0025474.1 hypothetical protein [Variovorax sp. J31P216]
MNRPLVFLAMALALAGAAAQAPIAVQPVQIGRPSDSGSGSGAVDRQRPREQDPAWQPTAPGAAPAPLGSCNAGGCWDSQGNRYNSTGDGSRFISPQGRPCQVNGQFIQCN